jgi:hypothetical protein
MRKVLLSATIVVAVLTSQARAASGSRDLVEWMRYQRKLEIWQRRQQQIIDRQQARTERILRIKFGGSPNARLRGPVGFKGDPGEVPNDPMRLPPDQLREMAERFRKEHPEMKLKRAPR